MMILYQHTFAFYSRIHLFFSASFFLFLLGLIGCFSRFSPRIFFFLSLLFASLLSLNREVKE